MGDGYNSQAVYGTHYTYSEAVHGDK
jgi:hypothetical protein